MLLRRLINLPIGLRQPNHHAKSNKQSREDLHVWLESLLLFSGKACFLKEHWLCKSALHLYTDASGALGFGAVLGQESLSCPRTSFVLHTSTALQLQAKRFCALNTVLQHENRKAG